MTWSSLNFSHIESEEKKMFRSCLKPLQFDNKEKQGREKWQTYWQVESGNLKLDVDIIMKKHKWKTEALTDSCMTKNGSERWQEK